MRGAEAGIAKGRNCRSKKKWYAYRRGRYLLYGMLILLNTSGFMFVNNHGGEETFTPATGGLL